MIAASVTQSRASFEQGCTRLLYAPIIYYTILGGNQEFYNKYNTQSLYASLSHSVHSTDSMVCGEFTGETDR